KGLPAINLEFLTSPAESFGSSGGIITQIVGSVLIVLGAAVFSLPIALGTTVYQTEFLTSPHIKKVSDTLIYVLNGVPSIVFGLFGLIFYVHLLGLGISWIVGSLILGTMIIPTIIVSIKNAIESIAVEYREAGEALGLSKWRMIGAVILPNSIHGMITGLLMGLARAAGETAPIMFTATVFSGVLFPSSFSDPVTTLPTHILYLSFEATNPQALMNARGATLVLLSLVFGMSLVSLYVRWKYKGLMKE
ncbi:MAG: phosphate ABC transporter permease PstA, partial [Candidatus Hydrothermarchaeaceae archaeon]